MRLQGKRILITGAAGGIGRSAAELFYKEGARLVLSDLDEQKGKELQEFLPGSLFIHADISKASQVEELFQFSIRQLGGLDGLFHSAGIVSSSDLLSCTEEHFDKIMAVHLKGSFLCLKCCC